MGGGLGIQLDSSPTVTDCLFDTLVANAASQGGGLTVREAAPSLQNTIIAFSSSGKALCCLESSGATLICCDLYGNDGGDWIGCIAPQLGTQGNIATDPLFCDLGAGDFTLQDDSPCAPFSPPNPECDLIGAQEVGCGGTPTRTATWGGIKALLR
ncbi:MAG: hypothetical protein KAY24_11890 [Candidatus Eisenbacteria sp.]|nr:hypothetical protein [Candidatus Eisenbacteria bacterium]